MVKNYFDGTGLIHICERCRVIVATNFNGLIGTPTWIRVPSRHKDKGAGRGRMLDFCTDKCKIVYLRGRKYYNEKLQHQKDNEEQELLKGGYY